MWIERGRGRLGGGAKPSSEQLGIPGSFGWAYFLSDRQQQAALQYLYLVLDVDSCPSTEYHVPFYELPNSTPAASAAPSLTAAYEEIYGLKKARSEFGGGDSR